jgi:hypothetical protein
MISLPNQICRKYTVKYIDGQKVIHNLELYAFSIEQARQDAIDLIPYVNAHPDSILGITEHSK